MLGTFGYLIQFGLGVLAFTILILKRCCEKPPRPWKIWALDASKQIFSAALAHILNLILSVFMSGEKTDECVFYFINTLMDCTVGVFVSFLIMKLIDKIAKNKNWKNIQSGLYYEIIEQGEKRIVKLKYKMYFSQLGIWLIVTIITKSILILVQTIFDKLLKSLGTTILTPFDSNGKMKLFMVMVVFPLILDAFYFWVVDNILKLNPNEADKEIQNIYLSMREEVESGEIKNQNVEIEVLQT